MKEKSNARRSFVKNSLGISASLGILPGISLIAQEEDNQTRPGQGQYRLDNPLIMLDGFHNAKRTNYSIKARINAARLAGYQGIELVTLDPASQNFQEDIDAVVASGLQYNGVYFLAFGVVDYDTEKLEQTIKNIYLLARTANEAGFSYINLALQGHGELKGENVNKSGSSLAEDRHWERAIKMVTHFEQACSGHGINGHLYPHSYYVADTPEAAVKLLRWANASYVSPAWAIHHWYLNSNAGTIPELFSIPEYQNLQYVLMSNLITLNDSSSRGARFDLGEIEMAYILAVLLDRQYAGPIASYGSKIGDPYQAAEAFVKTLHGYVERFNKYPELWPLL